MKPKILLTIFRDERGGRQISLENTASVLEELGFETRIVALFGDRESSGLKREVTHLFPSCETKPKVDITKAISAEVERLSPSYVVNFSCPGVHHVACALIERVDVLYSYYERPLYRILNESVSLAALVGQTGSITRILRGMVDEQRVPVHWIPNYSAAPKVTIGRQSVEGFRIINIARNHPVKNLKAFIDVARQCGDFTFVLVTNSPLSDLPDNVELHIDTDHLEQEHLLASSHLYLSLSFKEGISNTSLRAFAHGLPSILTDADGITGHLMRNAWVVDSFSVMPQNTRYATTIRQIADAVRTLAVDDCLRAEMSNASRSAAGYFGRAMVRHRWAQLFEDVERVRAETRQPRRSRRSTDEMDSAVREHLKCGAPIDAGGIRGQPFAPYLCPDTSSIPTKVSIIFMSYGFSKRCEILLRSIELQQGVPEEQIEIITLANHDCTRSKRFSHQIVTFDESVEKAKMLNLGAGCASGDILVFTDADALLPPYFLANLLTTVNARKLFTSVRKNLAPELVELLLAQPSVLETLDYEGLRNALPDRWSFDWILHTPSGFLHILPQELFQSAGRYDEERFKQFDGYDWEFASRVCAIAGQPILVPDLWAIHLDHVRDYSGNQIRLGRVVL